MTALAGIVSTGVPLLQTGITNWDFSRDVDVFLGLAGIAGIFVGFAALIGLTGEEEVDTARFIDIRGVERRKGIS